MPALPREPSDVARWADLALGHDGPWSVFATTADGERIVRIVESHAELEVRVSELAPRCNVWVGMGALSVRPAPGARGTAEQIRGISSLWLDIDLAGPGHARSDLPESMDDAARLLATFPAAPSCIVHTGGGLHVYWTLAEELPAVDAAPLLERWGRHWTAMSARFGWHLDPVWDLTRVLRVPGTWNRKGGGALPVSIVESAGTTWNPSDLEDNLTEQPAEPSPVRHLAPVVGYVGPKRPGDDFAARHTCAEVLAAQGWALHHTDRSGNQHWTRPGKERREGTSATVYAADGRCVIWTSSLREVSARESLNPYRLVVKLVYGGDFSAASRDLAARGYGEREHVDASWATPRSEPIELDADGRDPLLDLLVDWTDFWGKDRKAEEWLAKPLLPRRRSISIHAPGGTGKSLLALYVAAALATGRPCLGMPAGEPMHVLYADYEMTESDLAERLEAMGYGGDVDLDRLHYALLPAISPLDTHEGAEQFRRLAALVDAELCVIDTFARAVAGDENEADTVRAFYRHTGSALKADGRTLVRIDHTGKDPDKGARGTSAKRDDVDVVWRMTPTETGATMKAEKRRVAWVPETVHLDRLDEDDLIWTVRGGTSPGWPAGTADVAARLDALDVPVEATRRQASEALRMAGQKARNSLVGAAQKYRRDRPILVPEVRGPSIDVVPGDHARDHGDQNAKALVTAPGTKRGPTGTNDLSLGPRFPLYRAGPGPDRSPGEMEELRPHPCLAPEELGF